MSEPKNYSKFTIELSFKNIADEEKKVILNKYDEAIIKLTGSNIKKYLFKNNDEYLYLVELAKNNFSYRVESINKYFKNISDIAFINVCPYNKNTLKNKLIELITNNWVKCDDPKISI